MGSSPTSRTMKRKYRIKEYLKASGTTYYKIEYRCFFMWIEHYGLYNNYEDAQRVLDERKGLEVVKTRIITDSVRCGSTGWGVSFKDWLWLHGIAEHVRFLKLKRLQ